MTIRPTNDIFEVGYTLVDGVLNSPSTPTAFENTTSEVSNGAGANTGNASTTFVPTETRDYVFEYSGEVQQGTGGISIGTTVLGTDLFVASPASGDADGSRLTPTRQENFTPPIPLTAGDVVYITQWAGGSSIILNHTVITQGQSSEFVDWIKEECFNEEGDPVNLNNFSFLDEINPAQFATLPVAPHMRWTAPSPTVLNTLQIARLGTATNTTISWATSNGQSGTDTVTGAGNPLDINLGGITLDAGDTIDFTLEDLVGGQMQLATPAQSVGNGWTALQDYSGFANTSHWSSILIGSDAPIKRIIRTREDDTLQLVDRVANTLEPLDSIPENWTPCPPVVDGVQALSGEHVNNTDPENPVALTWIKEECYNETGTTNTPQVENNGDMLVAAGAVAPVTAPLRLENEGTEPIQINQIRVRAGANGFTPTGTMVIGGVTYTRVIADDTDINGVYRTIVFNPDTAPLLMQPGEAFDSTGNWGSMTGGFQGPVSSGPGDGQPINNANTQARAEINFTVGTPDLEHIVRTYDDGSLFTVDKTGNTVTSLASIPADWTLKPEVASPTGLLFQTETSATTLTGAAQDNSFSTFTPHISGEYDLRHFASSVIGNIGLNIGTILGGSDIFSSVSNTADRITETETDKTFVVTLEAETEYFIRMVAGGGSIGNDIGYEFRYRELDTGAVTSNQFNLLSDIPSPETFNGGDVLTVSADPVAENNGPYLVLGTVGQPGTSIIPN